MSFRDEIKRVVREQFLSSAAPSQYRISTANLINPDGTVNVLVDGKSYIATPLYPIVQGQEVVVIFGDRGAVSAVPTRPNTPDVEIIHPPFFSGGFIRFATGLNLQQAGDNTTYVIDVSDLLPGGSWFGDNGTAYPVFTGPKGAFSPDGTQYVIVVSGPSGEIRIRQYKLGLRLIKTTPINIPNNIWNVRATLVNDVSRVSGFSGPSSLGTKIAIIGVWLDSSDNLYWLELQDSRWTLVDPQPPEGTVDTQITLFKLVSGSAVSLAVWSNGSIINASSGNAFPVWGFSDPTIFDATQSRVVINTSDVAFPPSGNNSLASVEGVNLGQPPTLGSPFTIPDTFAVATSDGPYTMPSSIPSPHRYSVPNGPGIQYFDSGNSRFLSVISGGASEQTRNAISALLWFRNPVPQPPPPLLNYPFLQNLILLLAKPGASAFVGASSIFTIDNILPDSITSDIAKVSTFFQNIAFFKNLSNGLFVDANLRVRPITQSNPTTYHIETDASKFLKVSPGNVDPTILVLTPAFRQPLTGVQV